MSGDLSYEEHQNNVTEVINRLMDAEFLDNTDPIDPIVIKEATKQLSEIYTAKLFYNSNQSDVNTSIDIETPDITPQAMLAIYKTLQYYAFNVECPNSRMSLHMASHSIFWFWAYLREILDSPGLVEQSDPDYLGRVFIHEIRHFLDNFGGMLGNIDKIQWNKEDLEYKYNMYLNLVNILGRIQSFYANKNIHYIQALLRVEFEYKNLSLRESHLRKQISEHIDPYDHNDIVFEIFDYLRILIKTFRNPVIKEIGDEIVELNLPIRAQNISINYDGWFSMIYLLSTYLVHDFEKTYIHSKTQQARNRDIKMFDALLTILLDFGYSSKLSPPYGFNGYEVILDQYFRVLLERTRVEISTINLPEVNKVMLLNRFEEMKKQVELTIKIHGPGFLNAENLLGSINGIIKEISSGNKTAKKKKRKK